MSLASLLGDLSPAGFVAEHFGKLPYSRPGGARELCRLGDWAMLERLLQAGDADVMVVRAGAQHPGPAPTTLAAAQALAAEGYTVLVRHAERHDSQLAALADAFARDFAAPVDIQFYATPGGQWGFGWHYDAEEVFICQTAGEKVYSLRKNTVNPWPLLEAMPLDLHYEREIMPLMRCPLAAGDWLYVPSGYWHKGESRPGETALSLAIGVLPPTALRIYDALRPQLLASLLWRQRLPVAGAARALAASEIRAHLRELLPQLAADLERAFRSEAFVEELLDSLEARR